MYPEISVCVFTVDWEDNFYKASQICRCLCIFVHKRLTSSISAYLSMGPPKKNSEGPNVNMAHSD